MIRYVGNIFKNKILQPLRSPATSLHIVNNEREIPSDVEARRKEDMPVEIENPFAKDKPQCVLCKYDVHLDYKNVRLLSQFVSSFSGKIYGRHISGLCERQQNLLEKAIKKARGCGLMPYYYKEPVYMKDPPLFDPERPFRPHKY